MTNKLIITYTLDEVTEGFVSRCTTNDKVTAFGTTKEEAGNNLIQSIQEYLEIYPEKHNEFVNIPMKEMQLK